MRKGQAAPRVLSATMSNRPSVTDRLRQSGKLQDAGGAAAVDELAGLVPAAAHARRYAQIVRENALLRRLLTASYEIQASVLGSDAPDELDDAEIERSIREINEAIRRSSQKKS